MSKPKQFITAYQKTNRSAKQPFSINQHYFSNIAYRNFALGLFSFLIAFLVASTFAPVHNSDASTVTITNNTSDFFIQITSADALSLDVTSSPTGQMAITKDTLNIVTNSPNGYKLYVSTSGGDNNIYQDGDSSASTGGYFYPTTGSLDMPIALSQNTWGFALNKNSGSSFSANFADTSKYSSGNPSPESTWASVPTILNSETAKISEESNYNSPDGTNLDIYFGVNASTTLPNGNYSTEITYTAISEGVNQFPTMQDFTAEQCYNMATDTSINLSDSRDDKYYRITKMKDGHCWMTDNLALDGTDAAGNVRVLTPSNSNVTANRTLAENIEDGTVSSNSTIQIYSGLADAYTSATEAENFTYSVANSTKFGNLYNFMAATAGTYSYSSTQTNTKLSESVCPKGWQLPNYSNIRSWISLFSSYGLYNNDGVNGEVAIKLQEPPFYITMSGTYNNNISAQYRLAEFWTNTVSGRDYNDDKYINSLVLNGATGQIVLAEGFGYSPSRFSLPVRCVFAGQSTDLTMQDFTTTMCNNLATDASKVLVDRRNNQFYRVVHAKDGNCWMADNLSIYNQTISATDSDFTSPTTYTIPASITATTDWNTNIYNAKRVEVAHGLGANASTDATYYGQVYYNWTVAVAKETTTGVTTAPGTSICPKNWQLPVNGDTNTNKSWAKLLNAYGITTGAQILANSILGFTLYYGRWNWGGATEYYQGSVGNFWSGTPSSENAYNLDYNSGAVNPQNYNSKGVGFSIRCILR